jgi:serine-type D-Ala-D-Ala carboxypeptidase/endopeptidase (penicillin-binding protein 4)
MWYPLQSSSMNSQMTRLLFLLFISLSAVPVLCGMDSVRLLRRDLMEIFSDQRFSNAQWGVSIGSLDRRELLFEKNSRKLFIPASNNKILTAATALLRLGPDYRFKTQVFADGPVEGGIMKGNLIIVGFGDPSGSSRMGSKDPFEAFRNWASRLKNQGIRAIEGKIIGDGSAFEETPFGQGWAWDDLTEGYAAPISALQFNENLTTLEISPGPEIGSFARLATKPLSNYPPVDSKIRTEASGISQSIEIEQDRFSEALRIRGALSLKSPPLSRSVAAQFPIRYYLLALKQVLTEEGIDTTHCIVSELDEIQPQSSKLLWTHTSLPLLDLLAPTLKLSLNLLSETLLRTMGLELRGEGSYAKGKEVVDETLSEMGMTRDSYCYADASGLSRLNLVTPEIITGILTYMHKHRHFSHFYSSLSIAGVDGTLKNRMIGTRAENNVHAKTGTLSHVSAISGYVQTSNGEMLVFSLMANNFPGSKDLPENLQDRVLSRLADFSRKTENRPLASKQRNKRATAEK